MKASGVRGQELDSLEALGAKNMVAPEHTGAFVVMVVLLVADGAFDIHRLLGGGTGAAYSSVWVVLLKHLDNVSSHDGAL